MSLLMQALKKAERAKQNSLPDEELEKPSEAYDQVLALAPADAVPLRPAPAAAPPSAAFSTLSLEPLGDAPPPAAAPVPPAEAAAPQAGAAPQPASAAGPEPAAGPSAIGKIGRAHV